KVDDGAIVENRSDGDGSNVQLSVVRGRPSALITDLYQPLDIPRRVVMAELYASLRPQTYEGATPEDKQAERFGVAPAPAAVPLMRNQVTANMALQTDLAQRRAGIQYGESSAAGTAMEPMNAAASVATIASAA